MTLRRRFAEPLLVIALTVAGLVAALVGEGTTKTLGVAAVAIPLLAILRHGLRASRLTHGRPRSPIEEENND